MAQDVQIVKPQVLNLDKSPKYLGENEAFYLLNHEVNTSGSSDSLGKSTPIIGNYPGCEMEEMPVGENYSVGGFESKLTNEDYDFVYNSNKSHYIKRLNSKGECEIVYHGDCLQLSADPKHFIAPWRAYMKIDKLCDHAHGKQIIWTDGKNPIGQLDVEASIATNFFTTPFFDVCPDRCAYISMCVPQPCQVITAEYVPLSPGEERLTNKLNNRGFQFRYRHVYYDGRASEWSDISTLYFQDTGGCFETMEGLPRCMKLRIPIGNPFVEKIELAFREDNNPQWRLYDTIEKYNPYSTPAQFWYERDLSPIITSNNFEDCSFDYYFCNDKQCQTIDVNQTNRVFNPMPRQPQGLFPFKDSLAFYNFEQGNCPISKNEIDKFEIKPICNLSPCVGEQAIVTVRALIIGTTGMPQFVWRGGGAYGGKDDIGDPALFGGYSNNVEGIAKGWNQKFSGDHRNFTVYIEGSNSFGEMEQWVAERGFINRKKVGIVSGGDNVSTVRDILWPMLRGNFYFYQEYTFRVPKGTKGLIRMANQDMRTRVYHDTSANVIGVVNSIENYRVNASILPINEIPFDTCNGDVDIKPAFMIRSTEAEDIFDDGAKFAYSGYITDNRNKGVEFAEVWGDRNFGTNFIMNTDWNGYYFFYGNIADSGITVEVKVEKDCVSAFQTIKTANVVGIATELSANDIKITDVDYANGFYEKVRIPIRDCNGSLVSGIRVALTGSKSVVSVNGVAEFKVRNRTTRHREVVAYIMDAKGCFQKDCNGNCDACMPQTPPTILPNCFPAIPNITTILPDRAINTEEAVSQTVGLKSRGRYPWGFVVEFGCGKISAVNKLPYIDIPSTQEKGDLNFCSFAYNCHGIMLPPGAKCLKIVRGENVNGYELQWVVDKIERTLDNKIKLTIQSLNDYNASYNFKTNTIYQWLKGDRVEFIRNGDNKVFSLVQYGLLNYLTVSPYHDRTISGIPADAVDQDANFFNQLLIEDDGKLEGLIEGAIIEVQREKNCEIEPTFFEIGVSIPVNPDGSLSICSGIFNTFDTYIVKRVIAGKQAKDFEHHSPSDFWGDHLSDIGKVHFKNEYENERRYGRAITINSRTQFNYFGDIVKGLPNPEHGDITSMWIVDDKVLPVIGEKDNCILSSADELLRLNNQGVVVALPADAIISDPQPKLSGVFGCAYEDIGSVLYGDGWFTFVDSNRNAFVKHTFDKAVDVSDGKISTYMRVRCQEIKAFNSLPAQTNTEDELRFLNHLKYITGYNNHTAALQLTIKALRDASINNEKAPYLKPNETIRFSPDTNEFLGFASYTPERYSNLNLADANGCSMIAFSNTIPWIHPIIALTYNSFFGVAVDRVIGVAINKYLEKIKKPISIELQDEIMWFVSKIETDKPNVLSEIPPIKFTKDSRKWNGPFLKDINSPGRLYNGNPLIGFWCAVTFVRDNTIDLKYNTVEPKKQVLYDELDNFLFKFMMYEQSGYTENR